MAVEPDTAEDTTPSSPEDGGGKGKGKGKGKAKEEAISTNYRVYCVSRSYFLTESLLIQRFMFPAEMPARFFDIHRFGAGAGCVSEDAKPWDDTVRDECLVIVQRLVHEHTGGIFGTRDWPCLVCGAPAVKLLHGVIPHFEVKAESDGDENGGQGRGYYGASISIPLTEGQISRIGVDGERGRMKEARRWANRLALAPISHESKEAQGRMIPCIVDVTMPICGPGCEELADDFRRELATEILTGTFKVDPEDMPWWAADDGAVPSAEVEGTSERIVQCVACGTVVEEDILKCAGCEVVEYCSRNCQMDDWSSHKYHCDELRDRAHAAILVEMSQPEVDHARPEGVVDHGATGPVRILEEFGENLPADNDIQDARAEDSGVEEITNKPKKKKKKNKGRNKGKRKGKGDGKENSVEVKDLESTEPDAVGEAEDAGTKVGDISDEVQIDQGKEDEVVAKKPDAIDDGQMKEEIAEVPVKQPDAVDEGERKEEGSTWLPLL